MRIQGYQVIKQVRITGCELDLLCKHEVSGKSIYVECKAHREPLSAVPLRTLLGTIDFNDYSEGWLISTGPLGKDASGFMVEWEIKPREKREKLSIYHPERVLQSLIKANIIVNQPDTQAKQLLGNSMTIGEWTLLISKYGRFWAAPILEGGVPTRVLVFDAASGKAVTDEDHLLRLKDTDTSLHELKFVSQSSERIDLTTKAEAIQQAVVEVECGDKWIDYRPSRPEHFVGRSKAQRDLLQFFTSVKRKRTESRVFAIKGDSGIGKSSLVAKLRSSANVSKKPNNLFLYAVDVRAASDSAYVYSALLAALRTAASNGFSFGLGHDLEVSNFADPLQSNSIKDYLSECERKHELIILVFDQFEELYSKPELFPVFDAVKKLMFSTLAASTNIVLGFAWKTDSTVPQDHPAYYMWHQLSDHRYEISLRPFIHADADNSIRLFEGELGEKIRPELRRYIIENSQGYPWLLKKFCIHLYEQLEAGTSQSELADRSLDIASLFDRDLNDLTPPQMACLKLVAEHAPMDWYEVLESTDPDVVQSLQQKRLLIRRGDKLNLYWDIFRDYVLTGNIPSIPFTYIPQCPSLDALIRLVMQLDTLEPRNLKEISDSCSISENTARNIVHDLEQFGIAAVDGDGVLLDTHMKEISPRAVLARIRIVFRRHALTSLLKENNASKPASQNQIVQYLKQVNPAAQHHSRTWQTYANRMVHWLHTLGFAERRGTKYVFQDRGDINTVEMQRIRSDRRRLVFIGDAPPSRAVEAIEYLSSNGQKSISHMKNLGLRNACAVLYRFRLIEIGTTHDYQIDQKVVGSRTSIECLWDEANREETLKLVCDFLKHKPSASPNEIGIFVSKQFSREWTLATLIRIGNSLRQWASWLMTPKKQDGRLPDPPGRRADDNQLSNDVLDLFK